MASLLYKRYVPPKKDAQTPAIVPSNADSESIEQKAIKRKREQQEENKHEQEAKKAKSAPRIANTHVNGDKPASTPIWAQSSTSNAPDIHEASANSEFAHIKNIKKRHKLEKEARKQRKALGKGDGATETPALGTKAIPQSEIVEQRVVDDEGVANEQASGDNAQDPDSNDESDVEEVEEEVESDDNLHLKKHTNVMSKFQKAIQQTDGMNHALEEESKPQKPAPEIIDLGPLPQPEPLPPVQFKVDPTSLPTWLARPIQIPSTTSSTGFHALGLEPKVVQHLNALSFSRPLPVQEALIPLLMPPWIQGSPLGQVSAYLPGSESVLPDIAVSAPTGSGKTLAYLLPIIQSLKQTPPARKLRALVVVPTRELVLQVLATAEALSRGTNLQLGVAVGDGKTTFAAEQAKLVEKRPIYNPQEYRLQREKQQARDRLPQTISRESCFDMEALIPPTAQEAQNIQDNLAMPKNFIAKYSPAVDLLIATPGRLTEHLNSTLGFTLHNLDWLVLDEADKLLEQQYDRFLERIDSLLPKGTVTERGCRKIILSATMTKDVSKLSALKLRWPKLVVVGNEEERTSGETLEADIEGRFTLPSSLREVQIPVGDVNEKPLLLLTFLESQLLDSETTLKGNARELMDGEKSDTTSATSSSDDDSDDDGDDDSSESSSDSGDSSSDISESDSGSSVSSLHRDAQPPVLPVDNSPLAPTILIFTSTATSAARLAHLLGELRPQLKSSIIPITKTQRAPAVRPKPTSPIIAITTDRTSRGLDAILSRPVTHVVQYDVPRSLRDYVHRAGRSARAGRPGECWSFYEKHQGRWFVKEVLRSERVHRSAAVEKARFDVDDSPTATEDRQRFAEVVESMRSLVFGKGDER